MRIGQTLAVIDARNNRTSFSWDAAGRQTGTMDAIGNLVTFQFDGAGRRTAAH